MRPLLGIVALALGLSGCTSVGSGRVLEVELRTSGGQFAQLFWTPVPGSARSVPRAPAFCRRARGSNVSDSSCPPISFEGCGSTRLKRPEKCSCEACAS
jgi:hypothetical protein